MSHVWKKKGKRDWAKEEKGGGRWNKKPKPPAGFSNINFAAALIHPEKGGGLGAGTNKTDACHPDLVVVVSKKKKP